MDIGSKRQRPLHIPTRLSRSRMGWSMQRLPCADRPELLDLPDVDPAALQGNLEDLARVNRLLGGIQLSERALSRLFASCTPGDTVRLLDVGTGAGDIPTAMIDWARSRKILLEAFGVDRSVAILRHARDAGPNLGLVAAEGRSLPLRDGAVDVAHCSLLLHHIDPPAAVPLLAEMARVARRGVIVNDLVRSRIGLAGAWLLGHVATRNPLTRHDAPLSARRAYTLAEMTDLLTAAGLRVVAADTFLGYRAAVTAVMP